VAQHGPSQWTLIGAKNLRRGKKKENENQGIRLTGPFGRVKSLDSPKSRKGKKERGERGRIRGKWEVLTGTARRHAVVPRKKNKKRKGED